MNKQQQNLSLTSKTWYNLAAHRPTLFPSFHSSRLGSCPVGSPPVLLYASSFPSFRERVPLLGASPRPHRLTTASPDALSVGTAGMTLALLCMRIRYSCRGGKSLGQGLCAPRRCSPAPARPSTCSLNACRRVNGRTDEFAQTYLSFFSVTAAVHQGFSALAL